MMQKISNKACHFLVIVLKTSELLVVIYKGDKTALAPPHSIHLKGPVPAAFVSRVFRLADEVSYLQLKQWHHRLKIS